jgi:hypothetical protein
MNDPDALCPLRCTPSAASVDCCSTQAEANAGPQATVKVVFAAMTHLSKALHHLNNLVGAEVFASPVSDAALYADRECEDAWDFFDHAFDAWTTGEQASPSQKRAFAT